MHLSVVARNQESLQDPDAGKNHVVEVMSELVKAVAANRDFPDLFQQLFSLLAPAINFDFLNLLVHDPASGRMRVYLKQSTNDIPRYPSDRDFDSGPSAHAWREQRTLLIGPEELRLRFPGWAELLIREYQVQTACFLPLTTARRRLGTLTIGSSEVNAYSDIDVKFMESVATQVAVALENSLNFEAMTKYRDALHRERNRMRTFQEVNDSVASQCDITAILSDVSCSIRQSMGYEHVELFRYAPEAKKLVLRAGEQPTTTARLQLKQGNVEQLDLQGVMELTAPFVIDRAHMEAQSPACAICRRYLAAGVHEVCVVPLHSRSSALGILNVVTWCQSGFLAEDVQFLGEIARQLSLALDNLTAHRQLSRFSPECEREQRCASPQNNADIREIVGDSRAMKQVMQSIGIVAQSDSTVLVLGETGCGKELVARAVHNLSSRRSHALVKVNCASIPSGLLESELFGHEKGAFTGAVSKRVGRFELAERGSLFLDEIGDMPLELQPKLLRALQEREYERLGGYKTLRADTRVIAATNHDLGQMVEEKCFRSDLFYRLNVFPIVIPPLRERREDIPALVHHFMKKYSTRMNKDVHLVSPATLNKLTGWDWPGNVRELENVIERSVLLSEGTTLNVPLAELTPFWVHPRTQPIATLKNTEKEYILHALRECNGIVSGPRGAALRLGEKRSTLIAKMRRLGISLAEFKAAHQPV